MAKVEIPIIGYIGYWPNTAEAIMERFNFIEEGDEVCLVIMSPGGDFLEGAKMYNLIQKYKKDKKLTVSVEILGEASSMGSVFPLTASPGQLRATSFSTIMIHGLQATNWSPETKEDKREMADLMEKLEAAVAPEYAKRMGLTVEEFKAQYFDGKDHFLTAEEALEIGYLDEIISFDEDSEEEENPQSLFRTMNRTFQMVAKTKNLNQLKTMPTQQTKKEEKVEEKTTISLEQQVKDLEAQLEQKSNDNQVLKMDLEKTTQAFAEAKTNLLEKNQEIEGLKKDAEGKEGSVELAIKLRDVEQKLADLQKSLKLEKEAATIAKLEAKIEGASARLVFDRNDNTRNEIIKAHCLKEFKANHALNLDPAGNVQVAGLDSNNIDKPLKEIIQEFADSKGLLAKAQSGLDINKQKAQGDEVNLDNISYEDRYSEDPKRVEAFNRARHQAILDAGKQGGIASSDDITLQILLDRNLIDPNNRQVAHLLKK